MDRLACIELPELPARLAGHEHNGWRGPGYAREVEAAAEMLRKFSPHIEHDEREPGIFFVDVAGLHRLYRSASQWAEAVNGELSGKGIKHRGVVGFTRFGAWAIMHSLEGEAASKWHVSRTPEGELALAGRVLLRKLPLSQDAVAFLERLAVRTVADFVKLDAAGVLLRYGPEVFRIHRLARGGWQEPLSPLRPKPIFSRAIDLEPACGDTARLLFYIKRELTVLSQQISEHQLRVSQIHLALRPERGETLTTQISLAYPGTNTAVLADLVRLKLEALRLTAPVKEAGITLLPEAAHTEQAAILPQERPKRDLRALNAGLAQVRARWGEQHVVYAKLENRHLPEYQFSWQPLGELKTPTPGPTKNLTLIRRIYDKPMPWNDILWDRDSRCLAAGDRASIITQVQGPYRVAGGWWRGAVRRDYYFIESQDGKISWVFHDGISNQWVLCGHVE